jgi:sialate O-acetylesterase
MTSRCVPRLVLACGLAALLAPAARADVKLNPLFTDHMVLQRGMRVPIWGTADPGEEVTVEFDMPSQTTGAPASFRLRSNVTADKDGRWQIMLSERRPAGGPFTMTVQGKNKIEVKDILVGDVWICSGQSNMEWRLNQAAEGPATIENTANPQIRLFTVAHNAIAEPQTVVKGEWKECNPQSAAPFSAVGYFFGRDLQKALNVPIGLIHTSWGGTPAQAWTSKEALQAVPELQGHTLERAALQAEVARARGELAQAQYKVDVAQAKLDGKAPPPAPRGHGPAPSPDAVGRSSNSPTTLYNGMIAPLIPYAIKGAIWYQGESNAGRAIEYRTLYATMIQDWRTRWGEGDFPFLGVQLAPYGPGNNYAEVREAQFLATQKLPKVGMAVITDVGERNDIHPKKKEPVGGRLALLARKIAYGENIVAMGPVASAMKVEGNRAVFSFDNVGAGLECRGEKLTGFEVAGEDKKFHPAEAEIRGETVVVSSKEVERPAEVRFGWANYPEVNLWNKNGLPATPFRTDGPTWPRATAGTK